MSHLNPEIPPDDFPAGPRIRFKADANWWTIIGLFGLLAATLVASLLIGVALRDAVRSGDMTRPNFLSLRPGVATGGEVPVVFAPTTVELPPAPTLPVDEISPYRGGRITILMMGIDRRPGESTRSRTDSMMLLTIDPATNSAGVLSIPRDLYVEVPGFGLDRVNSANVHGGGELAKQTIEYNLGVPVHHYAIVDFNAFVTFVDEIGGIDIFVPQTINDPEYPDQNFGYAPFFIEAGQYHMDGQTALKYARTRATGGADFDRAQRQQAVLLTIRDKVVDVDMIPSLVSSAPTLVRTAGDSLETDMSLDRMVRLALLAREIPSENINTGVINGSYTTFYRTGIGADVLVPEREKIGSLMAEIFNIQ